MERKREEIEIMAPVGSYESLMAAIQAGAGSVYFGAGHLNMRARSSSNFSLDDIQKIAEICHEHKVKSYLTLNTVIYDHDFTALKNILDVAKSSSISAVIAMDIAVIEYARQIGLEVHSSTQLNISNVQALKFYAQFADVMVLARELSLKQVKHISNEIQNQNILGPSGKKVSLEIFAHGALCMAISGKCYLSLHENNASANRGACFQTCRKGYTVTEKETGYQLDIENEYIMSPKDLCTIPFIDKVIQAGVSVLKIEGRARSAEYVKTVTECYTEAVDSVFDGSFSQDKVKTWETKMSRVFNRGFWDGYYLGRKMGEWSTQYGSKATHRKVYVGKITNYFSKIHVGEIKMEAGEIKCGDEIVISGPTTGIIELTVKEIRKDLQAVNAAQKGDLISIPVGEFLRRSDKLYKIVPVDSFD